MSVLDPALAWDVRFIYLFIPFPCVPDRPSKILLVQVGTLSLSHPLFGVFVLFSKEKKENRQPKGGMGGRHAATTQGF